MSVFKRYIEDDINKIFKRGEQGALASFREAMNMIDGLHIEGNVTDGERAQLARYAKNLYSIYSRWEEVCEERTVLRG